MSQSLMRVVCLFTEIRKNVFPLNGNFLGRFSTQWKNVSLFFHSMETFLRFFPLNGKSVTLAALLLASLLPLSAEAGAGFWKQFVIIDRGSGNEYFGDPLSDNFDGVDLGTWVQGDVRVLNGGEANTWENDGDWVNNVRMHYRFGTTGAFTEIGLDQRSHSGNDRMWDQTTQSIPLTHRDPGSHTLQVYFEGQGNYDNPGGSGSWDFFDSAYPDPDYGATFTITAIGNPTNPSATAQGGNAIELTWTRWSSRNVVIVRNESGTFSTPENGAAPPAIGESFAGGTLIYKGSGSLFDDVGLTENTTYYYRFFSINNDFYSSGADANATTDEVAVPTISVAGGDIEFGDVDVFTTAPESYTVTGSALTEDISVSVAAPFSVATSENGPFGETALLPSAGGTVWVQFAPEEFETYNDTISHESAGATARTKAVSGTGSITLGVPESSIVNSTEVILQYFGTTWLEIARRIPEVAEAGYTSLWLPVPQKASGQMSVGYDVSDRFDLGDQPRAGGATMYGTKTDLLHMMRVAHRFGIRVYFDNVMAHTGGFMPEGEPYELNDLGFVPADFHIIRREDGTYYKIDWPDWEDEWQVLYRNPFSWDIATDWGGYNWSFGSHEGAVTQKWVGVRHPNNPEFYDFDHHGNHVGFGNVTQEMVDENPEGYGEEVNEFLMRSVRWFIDTTKADGFRLDAVKHVRADFFGAEGEGADSSDFGFTGQIQWQYNMTHGFNDWDNHRDSVFSPSMPRNDAMAYGEHLGAPPAVQPYMDRGMRIANDDFLNAVNNNIGENLSGMDARSWGIYGGEPNSVAHYVMSHDNVHLWGGDESHPWGDRPQAHALMLAREGLPIVYTDGYNQSGPPDYFPYPSHVPFLGQFRDSAYGAWMPNLLHIRRHFGWGGHWAHWGDQDHAVWVRGSENNHDGASMMFALVRRFAGGDRSPFELVDSVFNEGDVLYKYSHWGAFPVQVQNNRVRELDGSAISVGAGDWWAVSWRIPQMPTVWQQGDWWEREIQPIMILENDQPAETIWVPRTDGVDGDPGFNPSGLPNADTTDRTYHMPVPRVTSPTNLSFVARADGSAANILMKLNGGIDLNSQMWDSPNNSRVGGRDNPPGEVTDMYLGFEQMRFVHRIAEKFASSNTAHNLWGSVGATSYALTIGEAGIVVANPADTPNDWQSTHGPAWVYHDPSESEQFSPAPQTAADQPIQIEVEIGHHPNESGHRAFIYFTTDGATWPEGSAGLGQGATQVAELSWDRVEGDDNHWWVGTIPAQPDGTVVRYKIGAFRTDVDPQFPYSMDRIARGERMETMFVVTNFNAETIVHFPHNNWNVDQIEVGLEEGFHVLRTKAFLGRDEGHAPIYRERVQTFYYDVERPTGRFLWPANDDEWVSGSYGVVLRSDMTVTEVWYQIEESVDEENWVPRPWAQANRQSVPAPASDGTMELEWRFNYDDIPEEGWARIHVVLREVSSSEDLTLSDEEGHFTTLTRDLVTGGGYRIRIMNPPALSIFPENGELEVWLSSELWDGIGPEDQLATFSLSINEEPQPGIGKRLQYDVPGGDGDHAIFFTNLPSLYNGDPEYEHNFLVTFERGGFDSRSSSRRFLAPVPADASTSFADWLAEYALSAETDPDELIQGHEYTYWQAFIAQTNPHDPDDRLIAEAVAQANTFVEFMAREGRHYYLWRTDSLNPIDWVLVNEEAVVGDGTWAAVPVDMNGHPGAYFRLEVTLPPEP